MTFVDLRHGEPATRASGSDAPGTEPVTARGKSFYVGERKFVLKGATYGTFRPGADGSPFPPAAVVASDFACMAAAGINSVRTYTPPTRDLLDLAAAHGLRVLAGLPWEQHVADLDRRTRQDIERRVRAAVRDVAGHPGLLGYAVGNEIPGGIARWHGRTATERLIERLWCAAKEEDPDRLVTYVNFPTTEYLDLPFVDFLSFNVYLEQQPELESYIARLQNLAEERPLVMAELGLDSRRNGEDVQAMVLDWQLATAYQSGCAGAYVFAWTDEWHRGGHEVEDWDFGLVDRARRPKRALAAVSGAFERLHRDPEADLPSISVVVCSHNGERWLPGCLAALEDVRYPDFEVLVVSDGSSDRTAEIARAAGARVVATSENNGLSYARNLGMAAATGDVLAYLDDDARPDPDWLHFLGLAFARTTHVAIGGPNIPPPDDSRIAQCVANAPGGPVHVLTADDLAEHVPGCNLAVRRAALQAIGGFDPRFRIAGDDVDVCWRLQEAGGTIGFHPAAVVWHHRRPSVRTYLRQQHQYGRAEGLLERKWPQRYNRLGHLSWAGRIYGAGARMVRVRWGTRVRYGEWGGALFQSVYQPAPGVLASVALMPEWLLVLAGLAAGSLLGLLWTPLLVACLPLLVLGGAGVAARAWSAAGGRHDEAFRRSSPVLRTALRSLTAALHVAQPAVRLAGRMREGLRPWRRRCARGRALPLRRTDVVWSEHWAEPATWLAQLEQRLREGCDIVTRGSAYDRWDLQVRGGPLGVARVLAAVEEHGSGRQLVRFRQWPVPSRAALAGVVVPAALAFAAARDGAPAAAAVLAALAMACALTAVLDCALAAGALKADVAAVREAADRANAFVPVPASDPAPDVPEAREKPRAAAVRPAVSPAAEPVRAAIGWYAAEVEQTEVA